MRTIKSIIRFWIFIPIVSLSSCDKNDKVNDNPSNQNLYLEVKIDGITYNYTQYGFNGSIPPNSDEVKIANCGTGTNGGISIVGTHILNGTSMVSAFVLEIENPTSSGTVSLNCINNSGNDEASFQLTAGQKYYSNSYVTRSMVNQNCEDEALCSNLSVTFIDYQDATEGNVRGYFSGTLYENLTADACQSDIPHTIEGEFWLKRAD